MDVSTDDDALGEFRVLVRAAFEQAERSGKQGWDEMTTAVLKNRLLNLTGGQFSEGRYGSPSFIHLVRRIPDLVTVISEQPPHYLRLVTSAPSHASVADLSSASAVEVDATVAEPGIGEGELAGMRIRDDLWHAIIDYSTGKPYVYDAQSGVARPQVQGDLALPQFPTVSRDTVASWRGDFVASLDQATNKFDDSLHQWARGRGRQADLPGSLRGAWREFLKRKVVQNLLKWFQSQGIEPPEDMLTLTERRIGPTAEAIGEVVQSQRLRELIISAVRSMTYDELSQVTFPAAVWLRIHEEPRREK